MSGDVAEELFSCRERSVTCVDDNGMQVNDTFCDYRTMPPRMPKPTLYDLYFALSTTGLASCGGRNCFVGVWGTTGFSAVSEIYKDCTEIILSPSSVQKHAVMVHKYKSCFAIVLRH